MGGEYLPPLGEREVEIARISLASATFDQISVRARAAEERISYSIVDEYGDEFGADGPNYQPRPRSSVGPLSMGELVALLDTACRDGGAAFFHLIRNFDEGADLRVLERFVSVSSEFYPELRAYYADRISSWIADRRAELQADW